MARNYGRIETAAWRSPKLKGLGATAKLLWAYLIACPHGNALGCFVLPMGYVATDLELPADQIEAAMRALIDRGLIEWDPEVELIRIVGWWGHNQIENGNVAKGIQRAIPSLPKSNLIKAVLKELAEQYPNYFETSKQPSLNRSETVSEAVTEPIPNEVEPPESGNLKPDIPKASPSGAVAPLPAEQFDLETGMPEALKRRPAVVPADDLKSQIFGPVLEWLAQKTAKPPDKQRSLLGKWCSRFGDGAVLEVGMAAQRENPLEPVAWMQVALEARNGKRGVKPGVGKSDGWASRLGAELSGIGDS